MKNQPIIVIRKRRTKSHGSHGGAWKIAYADFMTAMMAFFLVMWLLSIASPKQLTAIAEYFRTPLSVALTGGNRSSTSTSPIPGGGDDPTRADGEVRKSIKSLTDLKDKLEKNRLSKLRGDLDQLIESDPRLRTLRPQLLINLVENGLRIQILDSQNRPMFENGSARVEPYMRDVLRAIAPVLNDIPNKISISGHTDAVPYANGQRGYSNWELSADRANASRRELITGGLADDKIMRVIGMSSTMSFAPNEPDAAINRRISLLVLNKKTQLSIEQENQAGPGLDVNNSEQLTQHPEFKAATGTDAGAVPVDAEHPAAGKPVNSAPASAPSAGVIKVPASAENPTVGKPVNSAQPPVSSVTVPTNPQSPTSANSQDVVAPSAKSVTKPTATGNPVVTPIITPETVPLTTPTGTSNPAVSSSKQPGSQQR
ncbi:flagellar motor protein MotB [Acerihabitans sp. TG2]|uniref:flagellar motor protein MotB n=1 Tax=Acerihabitans sp. TG2 TaxID=3096008 RepID=UPI002B22F3C9|nr:flagellar motor protein MotB [Acerihabitans sp. TG2]MEA9392622.1 flagellar motor protein MotB [Acerihabitans sp. TG2]